MKKRLFLTALGAAVVSWATLSLADIILAWDMGGVTSPATLTSTNIAANVDTSAGRNTLSRPAGLLNPATANSFAGNTWNLTDTFNQSTQYFSFTVAPAAGYELTITSLQFAVCGSASAPNNGQWGYSINGGSFVMQTAFTLTGTPSLQQWDFTDFTTTDSVEFRFWGYGAGNIGAGGASSAAGSIRIQSVAGNDLILNGFVTAVPEPGSLAMMSVGLAGMWAFSRRRKA